MSEKFKLTVSEDDLKHTLVMGSTRSTGLGMSAFSSKLAAEYVAAGGRVALLDVGQSFESLVTEATDSAK
jgi:type IV secretory pathway VirB4 component